VRSEGLKFEAKDREQRTGSWGGGIETPTHQLGSLGERCKDPSGGPHTDAFWMH